MILHPDLISESTSYTSTNLFYYLNILDKGLQLAFNSCNPSNLVKSQIKRDGNILYIKKYTLSLENKKVFICGAGKATLDIAKALIPILGSNYIKGIINIPTGMNESKEQIPNTDIIEAGHPIPNNKTFEGAQKQIDLLKSLSTNDIVFVIISGGASSLLELPDPNISQVDIVQTYKQLLVSGLPIDKINIIRKYLSTIKGGKLLQKTKAQIYSLLLSDVPGNDLSSIGSGPTIPDPNLQEKFQKIITNNPLEQTLPIAVRQFIFHSNKDQQQLTQNISVTSHKVVNILLGSNENFLESLTHQFSDNNINTTICSSIFSGEAKNLGQFLHQYTLFPYTSVPKCLIYGGESVVTIKNKHKTSSSRGGRNQELILSFIIKYLQSKSLMNIIILSLGTDGIDGMSNNAGAIFCSELIRNTDLALNDLSQMLSYHNSAQCLPLKYYIKTGQTGNNLGDILVLLTY